MSFAFRLCYSLSCRRNQTPHKEQSMRTFEVYGAGVGFIGYVSARSERGAKNAARKMWPYITDFSVRSY
jgi:hypothetical protein